MTFTQSYARCQRLTLAQCGKLQSKCIFAKRRKSISNFHLYVWWSILNVSIRLLTFKNTKLSRIDYNIIAQYSCWISTVYFLFSHLSVRIFFFTLGFLISKTYHVCFNLILHFGIFFLVLSIINNMNI